MPKTSVQHERRATRPIGPHYKWIALTNTTLGVLMASIDSSIVLISLPAIFNGIHVNPLAPGETDYFLWILLGYMVVTATLLVTFGRISDMFGRVRLYNMGFAIFAVADTGDGEYWGVGTDSLPSDSGSWRGLPLLKQCCHPDRRIPGEPAWSGSGHQPDRCHPGLRNVFRSCPASFLRGKRYIYEQATSKTGQNAAIIQMQSATTTRPD